MLHFDSCLHGLILILLWLSKTSSSFTCALFNETFCRFQFNRPVVEWLMSSDLVKMWRKAILVWYWYRVGVCLQVNREVTHSYSTICGGKQSWSDIGYCVGVCLQVNREVTHSYSTICRGKQSWSDIGYCVGVCLQVPGESRSNSFLPHDLWRKAILVWYWVLCRRLPPGSR